MRRRWIVWVGVVVALGGVIAGLAIGLRPSARTGPLVAECYVDSAIPNGDEALVRTASRGFMDLVLRGDPKTAYGQMSTPARAGTSEAEFTTLVAKVRDFGPFGPSTLGRAFVVSATSGAPTEASCLAAPGEVPTTVKRVGDALLQAFVSGEVTGSDTGRWFWRVSLSKEAGQWRVTRFDWNPDVD